MPSKAHRKRVDYVADFETTTDENDCRVWSWGIAKVSDPKTVHIDKNIDQFMEYASYESSVIYFHNLKFDGTFIIDWLLRNEYEYTDDSFSMEPGSFTSLISDSGKFYSIKVKWPLGPTTEFRDSLKKLPMSVAKVAKSFKLEESKGDLDYTLPRPVGWEITPEEADYLRRDVTIVAEAMKTVLDEGMTKLTVGSDSLAEYKHMLGIKNFNAMFPVLPDIMDAEIRKAYRGGFTYADPRFSRRVTETGGHVLDVNSLYPHVMYSTDLPYGEPEYSTGYVYPTSHMPLTIFQLTFTAKIKPNHIPCIQIKGSSMFVGTEYLKEVKEPTTLWITNVDYELWLEHYDITVISWDGGWRFKSLCGVFDNYIDKWSKVKAESTGGRREIAKLHLNSLYGKFAPNTNVTGKIPIMEDNRVKFIRGPEETRPPIYTAMGVFITAYARALTIRAAQASYDVFAYADTDSLHLLTPHSPTSLDIHPSKLGAWKLEYHFDKALYIRPKAYLEQKADGTYVNRVAGLPERISEKLTFDDIRPGAQFHGKLIPKNVPGGIVLQDVAYELKF
jgi:hypothetical protein